jgi:hypothetical protein
MCAAAAGDKVLGVVIVRQTIRPIWSPSGLNRLETDRVQVRRDAGVVLSLDEAVLTGMSWPGTPA